MCNPAFLSVLQLAAGAAENRSQQKQASLLEKRAKTEAALSAIEDVRTRERYRAEISRQTAQLATKGVSLDSPTALLLAEDAGREKSFASQEVRARGAARGAELSASARAARARGRLAMFKGGLSAAGTLLEAAPDIWPGLRNDKVLS